MGTSKKNVDRFQKNIKVNIKDLINKIKPKNISDNLNITPYQDPYSVIGQKNRLQFIEDTLNINLPFVSGQKKFSQHKQLKGNIENFIGMAQIPIGIAGPILINGTEANGLFYTPLATTEGALVASYSRGFKASLLSGGISTVCISEGVQRSPLFKFETVGEAGKFILWANNKIDTFKQITTNNSNYAKLQDIKFNLEGNCVILCFNYTTGDASGQNMVTICTHKICDFILHNSPEKIAEYYIESNYSGDKKATSLSFTQVRGKKVTAEVVLKKDIVKEVLKTTPSKMQKYWQASTLAVVQSGAIGAQGHVANGLTALFIACGQDVACISEAAIGITRMELTEKGDLYVAVTLPSLIVGTVGGGTALPTQKECLSLLDCFGEGKSKKFAEICTAVALAGEISIAAAMSIDHFAQAHKKLGR